VTAQPDVARISRAAFAAGAMFVAKPQTNEEMRVLVQRAREESSVGRIDAAVHTIAEENALDDDVEFFLRRSAHGEDRDALAREYGMSAKRVRKLSSKLVQSLAVPDVDAAVNEARLRATAPGVAAGMVHAPP